MVANNKSEPDAPLDPSQYLPQIEQAKKEWEVTVDALPQVICLLDKDGKIIRANRTIERWKLTTVYEVKGKTLHELLHPACDIKNCHFDSLWREAYLHLIEQTEMEVEIHDLKRERIYNVQFQPIKAHALDKDNTISSFASVTLTDITQQKQLESQLYKYVNQAALLQEIEIELTHSLDVTTVMRVGLQGLHTIVHAGKSVVVLLDNQRKPRQQCCVSFQEDEVEALLAPDGIITQYLQNQDISSENPPKAPKSEMTYMVLPLFFRDNLIGIIYLEAAPNQIFERDIVAFAHTIASRIASAIDNAQLYQLSQEQVAKLKSLNAEITTLEQLKTDMIRLASHDLRNPMAAIQLSTDILYRYAKKGFSEIQMRQLEAIKGAVDMMKIITHDILSLERIEALRKKQVHEVDLALLVRETFTDFELHAAHKAQDFSVEIESDTLCVEADEALVREVISNFISNAIKYTANKGKIRVCLYRLDDTAIFEVVDNGFGIPDEQQAQLFQPLYRAQNETTATIEGTGLGLNLTKNIIERFNGAVHFESKFGKGSTFGFSLPLSRLNDVD